tara:strand:+ start:6311 stop:10072 length:3762 start_codon:yes stop_codon:yes gene_type:complete
MDREAQVRDRVIREYFDTYGSTPSSDILEKLITKAGLFSPATKPLVPLYGALSNPNNISKTLHSLLRDRGDINSLLTDLSNKIDRVQETTLLEVNETINKTNNFLRLYKNNTFKSVYNEIPILYSLADVSEFYIQTYGADTFVEAGEDPDSLYIPQYILLDSQNVKSGKEGISLVRNNQQLLQSEIVVSSYSANNPVSTTTLSVLNPISAIVAGVEGDNKGINLSLSILDKDIATISIDTDPINVSIIIDGNEFLTKSLDGPTILDIHQHVIETLIIILYSNSKQVQVVVRDLVIKETSADPGGQFNEGLYVTVALPIDTTYGDLYFTPDEYTPMGTSIDWEYSSNRLHWDTIGKKDGEYLLLDWNSNNESVSPVVSTPTVFPNGSILSKIYDLPDASKDIKVKVGKGAILFKNSVRFTEFSNNHKHVVYINKEGNGNTSFEEGHQHIITNWVVEETENHTHVLGGEVYGTTGFSFYIEVLDPTGYSLSIYNPQTITGTLLFKNAAIQSESVNYSEENPAIIKAELDVGIHRVELEIADDIDLSRFDFNQKSILDVLEDDFLIQLDLTLSADSLGREAISWIQPYSLTETDFHKLLLLPEREQLLRFATNYEDKLFVKGMLPTVFSDIVLSTNVMGCVNGTTLVSFDTQEECEAAGGTWQVMYQRTTEEQASAELHYYFGDGTQDWNLDLYHVPTDTVIWNEYPNGDPVNFPYTAVDGVITIAPADLPDTTASREDNIAISGEESSVTIVLPEEPVDSTVASAMISRISLAASGESPINVTEFTPPGSVSLVIDSRTYIEQAAIPSITLTSDDQIPLDAVSAAGGAAGGVLLDPEVQFQVLTSSGTAPVSEIIILGLGTATGSHDTSVAGVGSGAAHVLIDSANYLKIGDTVQLLTGYTWYKYEDHSSQVLSHWPIEESINITSPTLSPSELAYTYTEPNKTITFSSLPALGADFNITFSFDYTGAQNAPGSLVYTHQQFKTTTNSSIVFLDREHQSGTGGTVSVYNTDTWDYVALTPPEADTFLVQNDATLNMDYIDLTDGGAFVYTEGDIINLSYPVALNVSLDGNALTIANIPEAQYMWREYIDSGTTIDPTITTELVLEHPVAFDSKNAISVSALMYLSNGSLYEEANISVTNIVGNIVSVDLSGFSGQETIQSVVVVNVAYKSYDHSESLAINLNYDFFEKVPYSFSYPFDIITPATATDVYSTESMLSYFYDISYYTTTGADLFLKALLKSEGDESPIIRRIGFERQ